MHTHIWKLFTADFIAKYGDDPNERAPGNKQVRSAFKEMTKGKAVPGHRYYPAYLKDNARPPRTRFSLYDQTLGHIQGSYTFDQDIGYHAVVGGEIFEASTLPRLYTEILTIRPSAYLPRTKFSIQDQTHGQIKGSYTFDQATGYRATVGDKIFVASTLRQLYTKILTSLMKGL